MFKQTYNIITERINEKIHKKRRHEKKQTLEILKKYKNKNKHQHGSKKIKIITIIIKTIEKYTNIKYAHIQNTKYVLKKIN